VVASYSLLLCREVAYDAPPMPLPKPSEREKPTGRKGDRVFCKRTEPDTVSCCRSFFVGGVGYRTVTPKRSRKARTAALGFLWSILSSILFSFFLFSFFFVAWGFQVWCCAIGCWNRVKHSFSPQKEHWNTCIYISWSGFLAGEGGRGLGVEYQYHMFTIGKSKYGASIWRHQGGTYHG